MNNGRIQAHRHVIGKIVLFQFSTLQRELQSARNIYDKLNIPVKTAVHQFPLPPPLYPSTDLGVGVHFHPERINRVDCLWFVHDSALCVIYLRGTQLDETFFYRWRIDKSNIRGCFVFLANDLTAKGWSPSLDGLLFRIFDIEQIVSLIRVHESFDVDLKIS